MVVFSADRRPKINLESGPCFPGSLSLSINIVIEMCANVDFYSADQEILLMRDREARARLVRHPSFVFHIQMVLAVLELPFLLKLKTKKH
jgi:hypothetical protein